MRIPGARKARLVARWITSRFGSRAVVLGYHRVSEDPDDSWGICVHPSAFERQLQALCRLTTPVSTATLLGDMESGTLRQGAAIVTFDDGYSEVLHVVEPLLQKYEVPATVFVSTGSIGEEFWWDRLERIVAGAKDVSAIEALDLNGEDSGEPGTSDNEYDARVRGPSPQPLDRSEVLKRLYAKLLPLPAAKRETLLDQLEASSGSVAPKASGRRALTTSELVRLASSDLIQIGSHSVSHPVLPGLPIEQQRSETAESKKRLEGVLGQPVSTFSYPNGRASAQTEEVVREAGYVAAFASHHNVVRTGTNRFRIPRFWIGNVGDREFSRRITHWLS